MDYEPPDREELCDALVARAFAMRQEHPASELDDGAGPGAPVYLLLTDGDWEVLGERPDEENLEELDLVAVGWLPYNADADICDDVVEQLLEELEELAA